MPRKPKSDNPGKPEKKNKQQNKSVNASQALVEVSWEVCNQVGGIYTVIRSKVPAKAEKWKDSYCLFGPYFREFAMGEFEEITGEKNHFALAAASLAGAGFEVHFGRWLVTGNPQVVLVNPKSAHSKLAEWKYFLWDHHKISIPDSDDLANQAYAFGMLSFLFLKSLAQIGGGNLAVTAHFHEWMGGAGIPELRRDKVPVSIVFTTHATLLGRYLATNNFNFYEHLAFFDWLSESRKYGIEARVRLERAAAHGAHCFSTVSEVTSRECLQLLGRKPDVILPNGLNIERFVALHEFQNLHREYKKRIHKFVIGHFFPSYSFDLEKTLYFFTSGRFEYQNKGFDVTLEALRRLNLRLQEEKQDVTVIMFIVTRQPFNSINPDVLSTQALTDELQETCNKMLSQISERFLFEVASRKGNTIPVLNDLIDDYWKLRLRRTLATWRTKRLPIVVTHNMKNDANDEILTFMRNANLYNDVHDRVKIVYHPDFISSTSPLFGMDYGQFVRGCHLGIFPSFYEPWGYTPLESVANGIPAVTSNLSGFGDYVNRTMPDHNENGIYVLERKGMSFDDTVNELVGILYSFIKQNRRERIAQRNAVESRSENFDWHRLLIYYDKAYEYAREMFLKEKTEKNVPSG